MVTQERRTLEVVSISITKWPQTLRITIVFQQPQYVHAGKPDPHQALTNHQSVNDSTAPTELAAVVDELLNSLSNKFAGVSSEIFAKSKCSETFASVVVAK